MAWKVSCVSWPKLEPGPKRLEVLLSVSRSCRRCATPPAERAYFFLPLVVDFLLEVFEPDDFLAELFFVAMALVPPFYVAQSKER